MNISFGKFIPVKVFIDGKEIKKTSDSSVPKEVERVTLTMCDCLSKDKNYPNSYLAEQQRRFFAAFVDDYKLPKTSPQNKRDILPSSVKTANIEGQRYLVTGNDIFEYKERGHELGIKRRDIIARAEDRIDSITEGMSRSEFEKTLDSRTRVEVDMAKQDRVNGIKRHMRRNERISDKTLYISAVTNPDAKLERDKYRIAYIDFKA